MTSKVTVPAFAVGSDGSILNSVSEMATVSPAAAARCRVDASVVDSVELVSLALVVLLVLSSPPHAASDERDRTIANRARRLADHG